MKGKYLPVGSVVIIGTTHKKVLITGYFGVKFSGKAVVYDYKGFAYPAGSLQENELYIFNHEEIESIAFMGYITDEYNSLNNNLLNKDNTKAISNFQFNENGVVIFDGVTNNEKSNEIAANPFKPEPIVNTTNNNNNWDNYGKLTFDKNGVVVSHDIDSNKEVPQVKPTYKFDKNGVLISDGKETLSEVIERNASKYIFDSNGILISDGKETVKTEIEQEKPAYKFDSNGILISDGKESAKPEIEQEKQAYKFDSNGILISDGKESAKPEIEQEKQAYKFDSNGILISDGKEALNIKQPAIQSEQKKESSNITFDSDGKIVFD